MAKLRIALRLHASAASPPALCSVCNLLVFDAVVHVAPRLQGSAGGNRDTRSRIGRGHGDRCTPHRTGLPCWRLGQPRDKPSGSVCCLYSAVGRYLPAQLFSLKICSQAVLPLRTPGSRAWSLQNCKRETSCHVATVSTSHGGQWG